MRKRILMIILIVFVVCLSFSLMSCNKLNDFIDDYMPDISKNYEQTQSEEQNEITSTEQEVSGSDLGNGVIDGGYFPAH